MAQSRRKSPATPAPDWDEMLEKIERDPNFLDVSEIVKAQKAEDEQKRLPVPTIWPANYDD